MRADQLRCFTHKFAFIAVVVSAVISASGCHWNDSLAAQSAWRFRMQLPGNIIALYLLWFLGPLGSIVGPISYCLLEMAVNAAVYYIFAVVILYFWSKSKAPAFWKH
jgi:hypothetical protein